METPHDLHDSVRLGIRQRAEESGIYHSENGRVGADAKCQSKDGYQREARAFAQHSTGHAEILPERFHRYAPSLLNVCIRIRSLFGSEFWLPSLNPAQGFDR